MQYFYMFILRYFSRLCLVSPSCNNVAPVTNLCLGRATTRPIRHNGAKKKVAVET